MSKTDIRNAIFTSDACKGQTAKVSLFGQEIELHQPTVGEILANAQQISDGAVDENAPQGIIRYLIEYAYVPESDIKVFEPTDVEVMKRWAWSQDLQNVTNAMNSLMGANLGDVEKN